MKEKLLQKSNFVLSLYLLLKTSQTLTLTCYLRLIFTSLQALIVQLFIYYFHSSINSVYSNVFGYNR